MSKVAGFYKNGRWITHYDHGYQNYFDGVPYRSNAPSQWKSGWNAAVRSDIEMHNKCCKPSVLKSIQNRVCKALGIDESELQSVTNKSAA